MNAQTIKLLVGDEIARISKRSDIILGKLSSQVGEMIAEELAVQFQDVTAKVLERLAEKEDRSTPEMLSMRWVNWKAQKEARKALEDDSDETKAAKAKSKKGATSAKLDNSSDSKAAPPTENVQFVMGSSIPAEEETGDRFCEREVGL